MKLSVIMSVYNGEEHLAAAIESIMGQTFREFEFLIVNDGSTDQTGVLLADYARRDPRIKIINHPKNIGLTASLNGLMQQVTGEYLARMDADDVCLSERFAKQVAWLDAHPACGIVGSAYQFMDVAGEKGITFQFENEHHFLQWYLCFQNPLAHPSVMGRTELFRAVGGYRERFRYGQDFDLWWRLGFITQMACLPEPMIHVRRNPAGVSGVHQHEQLSAKGKILVEMLPKLRITGLDGVLDGDGKFNVSGRIEYIRKVYASFAAREEIPGHVRELIRQDAAMRLMVIFLRHPVMDFAGLWEALQMDPGLPLRALGFGFCRLVNRLARNPIIR
jgi:glycosyltransferase involved in cell wall biosynthesis